MQQNPRKKRAHPEITGQLTWYEQASKKKTPPTSSTPEKKRIQPHARAEAKSYRTYGKFSRCLWVARDLGRAKNRREITRTHTQTLETSRVRLQARATILFFCMQSRVFFDFSFSLFLARVSARLYPLKVKFISRRESENLSPNKVAAVLCTAQAEGGT